MSVHGLPPPRPQQLIRPSWPPHRTQELQKHWCLVEAAAAEAAVVAAAEAAAVAVVAAAVGEEVAEEDSLHLYPQHQASEMATEASKAIHPRYLMAIAAKAINS